MTTKFISMQSISIRPQNDTERLMLENLFAMLPTATIFPPRFLRLGARARAR